MGEETVQAEIKILNTWDYEKGDRIGACGTVSSSSLEAVIADVNPDVEICNGCSIRKFCNMSKAERV